VQLGEHSGVGTPAFSDAETASQEIASVTIIMILRIVGSAPLGFDCWSVLADILQFKGTLGTIGENREKVSYLERL
jgi:hypothetical protein